MISNCYLVDVVCTFSIFRSGFIPSGDKPNSHLHLHNQNVKKKKK